MMLLSHRHRHRGRVVITSANAAPRQKQMCDDVGNAVRRGADARGLCPDADRERSIRPLPG